MMKSMRYVLQRNLVRLTWLGPAAGYLIVVVALMPYTAPLPNMLPILGIGSLLVAAWVSVTTIDADDPSQKSVVALASGGRLRARFGEAMASFLFVAALSFVGLVAAVLRASPVPAPDAILTQLTGCVLALLSAALVGVAIGWMCAWPVLLRTPLTLAVVFLVAVALIVAPMSPMNSLLMKVDDNVDLLGVVAASAGMLLIAAMFVGIGSVLVVRRWRLTRPG